MSNSAPAPSQEHLSRALDSLALQVKRSVDRGNDKCKEAVYAWLEAGRLLHDAKAKCPHGTWSSWVNEHVGMSDRQAQKYMHLWDNRKEIYAKLEAGETFMTVNGSLRALVAPEAKSTTNSLGEKRPPRAVLVSKDEPSSTDADTRRRLITDEDWARWFREGLDDIRLGFIGLWGRMGNDAFVAHVQAKLPDPNRRAFVMHTLDGDFDAAIAALDAIPPD